MSYHPKTAYQKFLNAMSFLPHPICRTFHRKLRRQFMVYADAEYTEIVQSLGKGDIVLDLGANYGDFTKKFAKTGATIHAFEPDPDTFKKLQKNTKGLKNVTLHQAGVGAEAGSFKLTRMKPRRGQGHKEFSQGSSIVFDHNKMDKGDTVDVEIINLMAFLETLPKPVKLIKMDIEGAEWDILKSLFEVGDFSKFENLFVETHERIDWSKLSLFRELRSKAANLSSPRVNLYWV